VKRWHAFMGLAKNLFSHMLRPWRHHFYVSYIPWERTLPGGTRGLHRTSFFHTRSLSSILRVIDGTECNTCRVHRNKRRLQEAHIISSRIQVR
jgi:hypothetical protein